MISVGVATLMQSKINNVNHKSSPVTEIVFNVRIFYEQTPKRKKKKPEHNGVNTKYRYEFLYALEKCWERKFEIEMAFSWALSAWKLLRNSHENTQMK